MAFWKYGDRKLTHEEVAKALETLTEEVCFKCGEAHSDKCTIGKLIAEFREMESE